MRKNRDELLSPSLRAVPILLRCVSLCLNAAAAEFDSSSLSSSSASSPSVSECVLQVRLWLVQRDLYRVVRMVMEKVLSKVFVFRRLVY